MQQTWIQDILRLRADLFDSANEKILDQVAHIKRRVREKAISKLTSSLDRNPSLGGIVFQTLPIEFLERWDVIWAIWYVETIWKQWNPISLRVVEQVLSSAVKEREKAKIRWDHDIIHVIDRSIDSLFRMAKNHPQLNQESELFIFAWNYEEIKGNAYKAISLYDTAIGNANMDAYFASATSYESMGQYYCSLTILHSWYVLSSDIRFLWKIITILCKIWKVADAYQRYEELCIYSKGKIPPFIVYKGIIENDDDLWILEQMIASYVIEWSFFPSESLKQLSITAWYYIAEQVYMENDKFQELDKKNLGTFTEDDYVEYVRIIIRRLRLMQTDILSLWNSRFLEPYLRDIQKLWIEWGTGMNRILQEFFSLYFSEEVAHQMKNHDTTTSITDSVMTEKSHVHAYLDILGQLAEVEFLDSNALTENILLHVARVGELFYDASYYDIESGLIAPILIASAKKEGEYDEKMGDEIFNTLKTLKNQSDFYDTLRPSVRKNYENFVDHFDRRYWVFYRRQLQALAISPDIGPHTYLESLMQYPEVWFFFWIQKALTHSFPTSDPREIEEIVQKYALDKVSISDALLLASLLYDISPEYAIWYLADFPEMLCVPEAIYVITEGLMLFDAKTQKIAIQDLHNLTKEIYRARGFFSHINYIFWNIMRNNPSNEDVEYMLLASGNKNILQKKEQVQSLLNFSVAASECDSFEWLLQLGELYQEMGEYDRAIESFEWALLLDESISAVIKLLHCTISFWRFDQAQEYINLGIAKGYDIWNYIIAFYLYQWILWPAFLQVISMIYEKREILDMPKGLIFLLKDTLNYAIASSDSQNSTETDILKIHASFIHCHLSVDVIESELENINTHWWCISSLFDKYQWDRLHQIIEKSFLPIMWGAGEGWINHPSLLGMSWEYLHNHALYTYKTYKNIFITESDDIKREKIYHIMNNHCKTIISLLQELPETEKFISEWRDNLNFIQLDEYSNKNIVPSLVSWIH